MTDFPETVKVVSSNPEHGGFIVKNLSDLTSDDVVFGATKVAKVETVASGTAGFESMTDDQLKAFLNSKGIKFHHLAGTKTLLKLAQEA